MTTRRTPVEWSARYHARIAARPQTLVLQPTTFCNLDFLYCYLPHRAQRNHMSPEVAAAVAHSAAGLTDSSARQPLGLVWHAGEPLALGVRRFAELAAPFEALREQGLVRHYLQTNATLVTDGWCDFLTERDIRVGVSIDGPAALNDRRVDRRRRPAFDRITRGVARLREHGIAFSVIAVVSHESIDRPEELLDFLAGLGCDSIGLNIEENEGTNTSRQPPDRDQATRFWQRVITWSLRNPTPPIRELERLGDYLRLIRSGQRARWEERRIDPIPTITAAGDVVLLSPELADTDAPVYDSFRAGNVLDQPLAEILDGAHRLRYVRDFLTGLDRCEATCGYFDFCRGAQAANRYFENHDLTSTETNYCRTSQQAPVQALSTTAREEASA